MGFKPCHTILGDTVQLKTAAYLHLFSPRALIKKTSPLGFVALQVGRVLQNCTNAACQTNGEREPSMG